MKSRLLFLLLIFTAQNSFAISNPFKWYSSIDDGMPDKVEIEELNAVGPHPLELLTIIKSLKSGEIPYDNIILLYGPSGTGKTNYAKEIAQAAGCNFVHFNGADVKGKFIGDGKKALDNMIHEAYRGGSSCPNFDYNKRSALVIDEVDAFANHDGSSYGENGSGREDYNINTVLFNKIDEERDRKNLLIIMTTNNRDRIPHQLLNRIPTQIEVSLPDKRKRKFLFKHYLKDYPEVHNNIREFAKASNTLSIRQIEDICKASIYLCRIHDVKLSKNTILKRIQKDKEKNKLSWAKWLQYTQDQRQSLADIQLTLATINQAKQLLSPMQQQQQPPQQQPKVEVNRPNIA